MERSVILYRGSLKSCNYGCSYCPFSKQKGSDKEQERDRKMWFRFVEKVEEGFEKGNLYKKFGGVMVAPYGEALIHSWYWEGMARLSRMEGLDAVGAQTNLSFSKEALSCFDQGKGERKKLRLWATFHPEMVSVEEFAQKCICLKEMGVSLCAGAVGIPGQEKTLRKLRRMLTDDIYLWINKMDGLGRRYSEEEQQAFTEIDPYFWRELEVPAADISQCRERVFVESDRGLRFCNISRKMRPEEFKQEEEIKSGCGKKICSCYLAYGGRKNLINHVLFGPYPVFRIPRKAKAVFLDIEGTLFSQKHSEGSREEREERLRFLETLAKKGTLLFFATTLPYKEALRRCHEFSHWFCGGVFAGGAHVLLEYGEEKRESFFELDENGLSVLKTAEKEFGFRILTYRNRESLYKLTLIRPEKRPWKKEETERLINLLSPAVQENIRWFSEDNCLQIVPKVADKANGVKQLCQWLNIPLIEILAVGDSSEDEAMINLNQI